MFIESKIKRVDGSRVTMADGATYHFAPDPEGRHVAFVTVPEHIERFLSITEGYRIAPGTVQAAPAIGAKPAQATPAAITEPSEPTEPTEPTQPTDQPLNREALEALYLKATGKKPHPAAKDETLLTAIKAARQG
ncbi:hypothetical protein SAMN05421774_10864 [Gemmobacter megaterium]|uniref:Uncharacterized protein n=1 Tax=Gemmobacter megaterium TaxID=1086013 RepID=A0A1N7QB61_9RHOB|nr:hypothetical protein [Gemmobacter megaterium]GGE24268.1 hypothetical protein GCM10011345_32810 [Gemmobacter megaterium]SIT20016.1 hypothetical protein SAMN05421774_10864 [Gemmobacter megaterium]